MDWVPVTALLLTSFAAMCVCGFPSLILSLPTSEMGMMATIIPPQSHCGGSGGKGMRCSVMKDGTPVPGYAASPPGASSVMDGKEENDAPVLTVRAHEAQNGRGTIKRHPEHKWPKWESDGSPDNQAHHTVSEHRISHCCSQRPQGRPPGPPVIESRDEF